MQNKTKLSLPQILISAAAFFILPLGAGLLDSLVQNSTITYTFIINTVLLILALTNTNLVADHYQRFTDNWKENLLFIVIGIAGSALILYLNQFLKANFFMLDKTTFMHYLIASPLFLCAASFAQSFNFSVILKVLTDRLKIKNNELAIILISAVLFAALSTLLILPNNWISGLTNFGFYFMIGALASYLYNQTHSIFTMIFSLGTVMLGYQLIILFL